MNNTCVQYTAVKWSFSRGGEVALVKAEILGKCLKDTCEIKVNYRRFIRGIGVKRVISTRICTL